MNKITIGNKIYYFKDGKLKYIHYLNKKGNEFWIEYSLGVIAIQWKNGTKKVVNVYGLEEIKEEEINPFQFNND